MNGYLILSLDGARSILEKKSNNFLHKKIVFFTDRVIVYNLLREKKLKVFLISKILSQKKFQETFKKEYEIFNSALKELDSKTNNRINLYYNSFRYVGSRNYAGLILILRSLKILIKKFKIKKFYLHTEITGSIFNKDVYIEIFKYFCEINSLSFELENTKSEKKNKYFKYISNSVLKMRIKFGNFSIALFKLKLKKFFTQLFIFKKNKRILIVEPEADLLFMKYEASSTYFKNISKYKKFYLFVKNYKKKKLEKKKTYLNIIINHLKNDLIFNKSLILLESEKILNFIKSKKIVKIFWGGSPNPYFANILSILKSKKVKIFGVQHGGKYFIQNDDIYHKDSDFAFCNKFLAYGVSKYFNKKKFTKNKTEILDNGCFKSFFLRRRYEDIKDQNCHNKILYVPTSSKFLLAPVMGSMEHIHYEKQIQICKTLNKINFYKIFIKTISRNDLLEYTPIYRDLKKYKNISINCYSLTSAIDTIKPKILICDSLSTSIYDCLYTNSEIIIFLDKNNLPKKDVLSALSKRVFFVKNYKEMRFIINKIRNNKLPKKPRNSEFLEKFHALKKDDFLS